MTKLHAAVPDMPARSRLLFARIMKRARSGIPESPTEDFDSIGSRCARSIVSDREENGEQHRRACAGVFLTTLGEMNVFFFLFFSFLRRIKYHDISQEGFIWRCEEAGLAVGGFHRGS